MYPERIYDVVEKFPDFVIEKKVPKICQKCMAFNEPHKNSSYSLIIAYRTTDIVNLYS